MKTIGVLASGRGSNFEAILEAIRSGALPTRVTALISDRVNAPALRFARAHEIPDRVVERGGASREEHERKILSVLKEWGNFPDFLVLAGYKRILGPTLIEAFQTRGAGYSRIVNIHPSLLPAFPGLNAYRQAFDYGCRWTGVTVHLVNQELDGGPIFAQEGFSIEDCRTPEEVEQRGLAVEHRLYPTALNRILTEELQVRNEKGRSRVCSS